MIDKKVTLILVLVAVNSITWLMEPGEKTFVNAMVYASITILRTFFALKFLAGKRDAGL